MPKHIAVAAIEDWCALYRDRIALPQIYDAVCQEFDLQPLDMIHSCRNGHMSDARRCYAWYCRRLTTCSSTVIGESLQRDHTSILNLNEKATGMLGVGDAKLSQHIINIQLQLKQLI